MLIRFIIHSYLPFPESKNDFRKLFLHVMRVGLANFKFTLMKIRRMVHSHLAVLRILVLFCTVSIVSIALN